MANDKNELKNITLAILDPAKKLDDLIPQAQALRDLFETRTNFCIDPEGGIGIGETRLETGLAISPTTAAMCIRELFRTTAFIRGLGNAVNDSVCAGRPVRVLYAGCGPYALQAVPLMSVFTPEQVTFTLLDIHQQCLDDAKKLIDGFGFSAFVDGYLCADATSYRIPAGEKPDVIVSETMSVALHNEPQVSIARNLLSQAPEAKMVPRRVSVEVCLLHPGKEHVLMPADFVGEFPKPERDRINLGEIFALDAESIHNWQAINSGSLPAGRVEIPFPLEARYRPCLLTKINVYGENRLQDYNCSLTLPKPLRGQIQGGDVLQFYYHLGNHPELRYDKVN